MTVSIAVLIVGPKDQTEPIGIALGGAGITCETVEFPGPHPDDLAKYRVAIIAAADHTQAASLLVRQWRQIQAIGWRPLLWIANDTEERNTGWGAGADLCLSPPFGLGELAAMVQVMLNRQLESERLSAWANESSLLNRTVHQLYAQLDADTRLARLMQERMRTEESFTSNRIQIATTVRRSTPVGSDFMGIRPVGSRSVNVLLGDTLGHSLHCCLLSLLVQQQLENWNAEPPETVLGQLSRTLTELNDAESPLVRLTLCTIAGETGDVRLASAGATMPVQVPRQEGPRLHSISGSMLGLSQFKYEPLTIRLQPGDRLLLYSDGLVDTDSQTAQWLLSAVVRHRDRSLSAWLDGIAQDRVKETESADEMTLLGIEYT